MRKAGVIVLLLLVLAAAGWSGAWVYAAGQATSRMDAWIADEHAHGRDWTCPGRATGGYPFALTLTCRDANYAGLAMGQAAHARFARITASVNLADPRRLRLDLGAPFSFRTSDGGTDVTGTWQALAFELSPLPDVTAVALHGAGVALDGSFAGTGGSGGATAALDARFVFSGAAPGRTVDYEVALHGAAVPALDALLGGGAAPADVALGGRLDHADAGDATTPEQAMEHWRRAGGRIAIVHSLASRSGASAAATGTLGLDEAHRLQGRLDAEFGGLGPVLARYGLGGNIAAVGSLVSALFGGGARKAPSTPGAIDLPISFNNGRLGIGPIVTPVRLTPLY